MKLVKEIKITEDMDLLFFLNKMAIIILLLVVALLGIFYPKSLKEVFLNLLNIKVILLIILTGFLLFILHELVHGLFFKIFNIKNKVKFGYTKGMLYAMSPGTIYSSWKFFLISIAPFIVVTSILYIISKYSLPVATVIFIIHTPGCVGDFYYCYLIIKYPKNWLIEDTDTGIRFYEKIENKKHGFFHHVFLYITLPSIS